MYFAKRVMDFDGLVWKTRPGRVGGGAAGHVERTLLDDGDVSPAAGDQLVGEVGADDAGADDHDALGNAMVLEPL